ncbi:MAG: FlgD immunoglobulin-like domain containing protein, partial [Bacteroidota bacterium]
GYNGDLDILDITASSGKIELKPSLTTLRPQFPPGYRLESNVPNPFTDETVLSFALPREAEVRFRIFNQLGQEVWNSRQKWPAGEHRIVWKGQQSGGQKLPSGAYYGKFEVDGYSHTFKMLMLN